MALCPVHGDKNRSLSIAEGRKVPVVLKCMSAGCDTRDILAAVGLTWDALFDGKPSPEVRRRMTLGERRAALERQLDLVMFLGLLEKDRRPYWRKAYRRIHRQIQDLRCELEPEKVIQEWQERKFQERVRRVGWDALFEEFWRQHGIHIAREGTEPSAGEVRSHGVHRGPPELPEGGISPEGRDVLSYR